MMLFVTTFADGPVAELARVLLPYEPACTVQGRLLVV